MSEVKQLLTQARQLMKTDKKKAKELLLKVVDIDQRNEEAWLYMSGVVDSKKEQIICLENVLSVNPNHADARQALQKLGKTPPSPSAPPKKVEPPPADDPWANLGFGSSDPFGGGDNPFGDTSSPWGSPVASEPDWMSSSPTAAPPPAAPVLDDNPFGDTDPWGNIADPWGSRPAAPPPAPAPPPVIERKPEPAPKSSPPPAPDFFDETPSSFFEEKAPAKTPFIHIEDEFTFDEIDEGGFTFEEDREAREVFGSALDTFDSTPATDPFAPEKPRTSILSEASRYYSQIPDELKLPAKGISRSLVIAIAVLAVLNVLALVGVLLAL